MIAAAILTIVEDVLMSGPQMCEEGTTNCSYQDIAAC
jgi:hypothetical protein